MGFIRLLIYIFLIWLAYNFIRRLLKSPSKSKAEKQTRQMETFVACHKCGLHIPKQEAIERDGRYYCSKTHLND